MNRLLSYFRRKLSVRVSLLVVLFAATIFVIAILFLSSQAREAVRQEAINHATQILDNTSMRVSSILNRTEVATEMTKWLVMRHYNEADSMFVYSRGILSHNPELYGCSIAFEPNHFKEYGRYFSAYSQWENDSIITIQEGNELYDYFYMDWYQMCHLLDRPCWTEPYFDHNPKWQYSESIIASYCFPLKNEKGEFIGTISSDISLAWLSKTISAMKPYPHSYSVMLGKGGTFFVHPDTTKLFCETIFTETLENPDTARLALGHAMQRGEEGMKQMMINGERCYVFYKPLAQTGWSMAIVCPESDIFGGMIRLHQSVVFIFIVGLMMMLVFFIRIISRELRPLQRLAREAEAIASGNFDTQLPDTKRIDEIGRLTHLFSYMQKSLVKYIDELKNTTAQKASIDQDLRIASSIQMDMLPKDFPSYPERDDVQIYASLTPAKEVGGDLFDFYFRDEKLLFCIGDVSGKGVPSSLFMAVTRSVFRTVSAHESMPDRIVTAMNRTIADMNKSHMFVTLFIGVLDLPTGRLYYCNAGHDAPLLVGKGIGPLACDANIPVGFRPSWKYTLQVAQIFVGTTIFLFTDGLTEAMNGNREQFEMERVTEVATRAGMNQQHEPRMLIQQMTDAVHQFMGDAKQSDDLTMMAIQYIKQERDIRMRKSIVLPNNVQEVPRLTAFVQEVCETVGFNDSQNMQIQIAIEEAVVNVMNYAYPPGQYGDVTIEAASNDVQLKFTIIDTGKPFDPTVQPEADTTLPANERRIGGLGIHIVRQIMDSINYERIDNLNVLTLRKKINQDGNSTSSSIKTENHQS